MRSCASSQQSSSPPARAATRSLWCLCASFAEGDESAPPLVPKLELRCAQPLLQREFRHRLELIGSVVRGLQVVVRDPDAQVVQLVDADVAGAEGESPWQLKVR